MSAARCPNCGKECPDAEIRGDSSFVCRGCGKAVEPWIGRESIPAPPKSLDPGNDRWSEGPPEDSANRWSPVAPLGDDSFSSESVSQTSILPVTELNEPLVVPARRPLLVRGLVLLALFLGALIGVIIFAKALRPWIVARRADAQKNSRDDWFRQLATGDEAARREAAQVTVALGPDELCRALDYVSKDSGDGQKFLFVGGAVSALAAVGAEAVPGLIQGLRSRQPNVRFAAVEVLQQMGPAGREARDGLLALLDDENRLVRDDAIDTLGYFGVDGAPATKRLVDLADSPDVVARRHAVLALGRIGPAARDALDALRRIASGDADLDLRLSASQAIKQIDAERLAEEASREAHGDMQKWLKAVAGDDATAAIAAAQSLGELGFQGRAAAPALALMLRHPERQRRLAAAKALASLGLGAADFTPTLEAAAKDEDAEVRAAVIKALEPPGQPPGQP